LLAGNDIILTGSKEVKVANAAIVSSGNATAPDEKISLTGSGALLRVSSDNNIAINRISTGGDGYVYLDSTASLRGKSVIIDASDASAENSTIKASLDADAITINANVMSLALSGKHDALLSGEILRQLEGASRLSLRGYSTMDFYGSGSFGSPQISQLNLQAGEMRGFGQKTQGNQTINAGNISLKGSATSPDQVDRNEERGDIAFNASAISFDGGTLAIDQFANVSLFASGQFIGKGLGNLNVGINKENIPEEMKQHTFLTITAPFITGSDRSDLKISSSGQLLLQAPDSGPRHDSSGLGAKLTLSGSTVSLNTYIILPSGSLSLNAIGESVETQIGDGSGDLYIGKHGDALIDVSGTKITMMDVTQYTDAGSISLSSAHGSVDLGLTSFMDLSANKDGGSAGKLSVSAANGEFKINKDNFPKFSALGGLSGDNGSFVLDVDRISSTSEIPSLNDITQYLFNDDTHLGFNKSLSFRVRNGDVAVDSYVMTHSFTLSVDNGSIKVKETDLNDPLATGIIDASGVTGGDIALIASKSVILEGGSTLNVRAEKYDSAGKGGSVFLSAGSQINGNIDPNAKLDLQTTSIIDLGVNEVASRSDQFSGTLHLRAPQAATANEEPRIKHLDSTIEGASHIAVELYNLYDLAKEAPSGEITSVLKDKIASEMTSFLGSAGSDSTAAAEIRSGLPQYFTDSKTATIVHLAPGVEIINQTGGITFSSDWDLSTLRVGEPGAPGFLTLRAAGDITFKGSLSDGFNSSSYNATLLDAKDALPQNFQSWSYTIAAGSDPAAANPESLRQDVKANILIGKEFSGQNIDIKGDGLNALTANVIAGYYQVIRTGSGGITIASSGDVQFWNQFASVYTAGVRVDDPTLGNTFDIPVPYLNDHKKDPVKASLGVAQQSPAYEAQFSQGGGNIRINAGGDIKHLTKTNSITTADSVRELPSSWLYRRGSVDSDGFFEVMPNGAKDVASTAWWVDFSNFFEGVGALGGGNIIMNAGGNIANVDAVIPTSFRMPGKDVTGKRVLAGSVAGAELGGGNLNVTAANNIDAGVYYVERGSGTLKAGGSILSNPTRDSEVPKLITETPQSDANAYLPTTLFVGKGNLDVRAGGDLFMGPVANVFLTPQGINNSFWYKDYFSTFAPTTSVNVQSLGGNITLRQSAVTPSFQNPTPMLELWMNGFTSPSDKLHISFYQPWLRTLEPTVTDLGVLLSLQPPTLTVTALSGDLTLQGNLTMAPSSTGNLSLVASGSIKGMSQAGLFSGYQKWITSQINLSDADPASIPGIFTPISQLATLSGTNRSSAAANANVSKPAPPAFVSGIKDLFDESGSFTGKYGTLQVKQQLHGNSLLHAGDIKPLRLYAQEGSISGLTLFSPKRTQISAAGDITDIGFYLQNLYPTDISFISSGGTITAFNPSSPLRTLALKDMQDIKNPPPLQSGDIQGNGPGTFEILAGKNIDLGNGRNDKAGDGIGVGITSIGNARNPALPALPSPGADIVLAAGLNLPSGLSSSGGIRLENFVNTILSGPSGKRYLSELEDTMTYSGTQPLKSVTLASLSPGSTDFTTEQKALLELKLFMIALRDNGRDYNKESANDYKSYASGKKAISAFFTGTSGEGSVKLWSRDIRTKSKGNITIIAPKGGLTLANTTIGSTPKVPAGIVTEHGGSVDIYTDRSVEIGLGRIFTLRGGDMLIWSDTGDIAAGNAAKTVASAPPTQVIINPQSMNVVTDLSGLATGGGIGVLDTVEGVPPGNVDLIAPSGVIDAGDAGIRSSGNLNLAATKILNADNIAASGSTAGAPPTAPPPAAPNVSGATAASTASAANNAAAQQVAKQAEQQADDSPSLFDIEVLGYGGGEGENGIDDQKKASSGESPPPQASL